MSSIEKLLSVGDLRSAGNSEKVVQLVLSNPMLFDEVVQLIFSTNPAIKMRACDAIEKITRSRTELLKPYKKLFLSRISKIEQKEVRWHIAQLLPRFKLTKKEREKVYKLMLQFLEDKSSIVRTFAMQALVDIALQDEFYIANVTTLIRVLTKQGSPAMKSRGKKLLIVLEHQATKHQITK